MLKNFRNGYEVSGKSETAKREKNDCVVRAVANACNVNYEQAHAWVKDAFGRKNGKGTFMFDLIMKQTKQIEFEQAGQLDMFADTSVKKIKYVGSSPKKGGTLANPKYNHKPVAFTVKEFARKFNRGSYIVAVNKHALAIKDGVIIDNSNYQYGGYRRVVESAFQVV